MPTNPSPAVEKPQSCPRWYRPTPDRLVLGLATAEALLLAAAWLGCLPLIPHKGWPVLIGIAMFVLAILALLLWLATSLLFRRRFQYSLRSLLILLTVAAVLSSWMMTELNRANRQVKLIGPDRPFQFDFNVDPAGNTLPSPTPPAPPFLLNLLGTDFFADISSIWIESSPSNDSHIPWSGFVRPKEGVANADIELFEGLPSLRHVTFVDTTMTDRNMAGLERLPRLRKLTFYNVDISTADFGRIGGLRQLRQLYLDDVCLHDAGFDHLALFSQIDDLRIHDCEVTDAHLQRLCQMRHLRRLNIGSDDITNDGLEQLGKLDQLEELTLTDREITDAGLPYLQALPNLRRLHLVCPNVTEAGVKRLQAAMPSTTIDHKRKP